MGGGGIRKCCQQGRSSAFTQLEHLFIQVHTYTDKLCGSLTMAESSSSTSISISSTSSLSS